VSTFLDLRSFTEFVADEWSLFLFFFGLKDQFWEEESISFELFPEETLNNLLLLNICLKFKSC